MKKLLLLATATIAILTSCSKKIDCYECITERYNEMADSHYTTKSYQCDMSLEEIRQFEKDNTGRKEQFLRWEGNIYNLSNTIEQHVTKCSLL